MQSEQIMYQFKEPELRLRIEEIVTLKNWHSRISRWFDAKEHKICLAYLDDFEKPTRRRINDACVFNNNWSVTFKCNKEMQQGNTGQWSHQTTNSYAYVWNMICHGKFSFYQQICDPSTKANKKHLEENTIKHLNAPSAPEVNSQGFCWTTYLCTSAPPMTNQATRYQNTTKLQ